MADTLDVALEQLIAHTTPGTVVMETLVAAESAIRTLREEVDEADGRADEAERQLDRVEEDNADIALQLEEVERVNKGAWWLAARLHGEAHGEREPFQFCQAESCRDLKDALVPEWREYRPAIPA